MKPYTCCFTGHRKLPEEKLQTIKKRVDLAISDLVLNGVSYFCTGGALGFDTLAALCVLDAKKEYPEIKLVLVLPCKNQTKGWKKEDISLYEKILFQADEIIYISERYEKGCMQKRNRALVEMSSYCVSYLTRKTGGAFYTTTYAKREHLTLVCLA